jgi:pimeloyl-ACP methyl ester carboxylesterase
MSIAARILLLAVGVTAAERAPLAAQQVARAAAVTVAGSGPETYVLVSGIVGGVAGYHRLATRLLERGNRVIVIDPFYLSIDSSDVSFVALARRVSEVLAEMGVTDARLVGHAHGAGVALRVAASNPDRVAQLYLLDAGALAGTRSPILSASLRLVPLIARIPGGRDFIRKRFVRGIRENAGSQEWLDAETQRAYTEPMLDGIGRATALAIRLGNSQETDSVATIVARIRVRVTVILGDAPHQSGPGAEEMTALVPLGGMVRIEHLAGVGHFPHEEAPDAVAGLLLARTVAVARATGGAR